MAKWKKWLKRYLPANIFSTILTVLIALLVFESTGNRIAAAFIASIADFFTYYGFILISDILATRKSLRAKRKNYTFVHFAKNVRNLILEFTVAELLDTLLIRPFFLYWCPLVIGNVTIGLIIGKYLSDIIFYIPTIIAYELRKKHVKD